MVLEPDDANSRYLLLQSEVTDLSIGQIKSTQHSNQLQAFQSLLQESVLQRGYQLILQQSIEMHQWSINLYKKSLSLSEGNIHIKWQIIA